MSRSATTAKLATAACSAAQLVAGADPVEEPVAEVRLGLGDAAADEVGVGVGEVGGDREHPTDRHRLLLEDPRAPSRRRARRSRAPLGGAPSGRGRPAGGRDSASARTAAGCWGCRLSEATLSTSPTNPQLQRGNGWPARAARPSGCARGRARRPSRPRPRRPAGLDHAAAEPGADDRRDRRALRRASGPKWRVVGVQRGRVAVVVVDDRQSEARLDRGADVEAPPLGSEKLVAPRARSRRRRSPARACRARRRARRHGARRPRRARAPSRRSIAATAAAGPSVTRLGISTIWSTRNRRRCRARWRWSSSRRRRCRRRRPLSLSTSPSFWSRRDSMSRRREPARRRSQLEGSDLGRLLDRCAYGVHGDRRHRGLGPRQDLREDAGARRPRPQRGHRRGPRLPRAQRGRQVHDDQGLARPAPGRLGAGRLLGGDPWADAVALHRRLAYVPGDVTLWPNLSGGEVIDLLGQLRGGLDRARRDELIERFELDPTKQGRDLLQGQPPEGRAGGRARPDVELLILDEPTSGLDPLMEAVLPGHDPGAAPGRSHGAALQPHPGRGRGTVRSGEHHPAWAAPSSRASLTELRHLTRTSIAVETERPVDGLELPARRPRSPRRRPAGPVRRRHRPAGGRARVPNRRSAFAALTSQPPTLEELFLPPYGDEGRREGRRTLGRRPRWRRRVPGARAHRHVGAGAVHPAPRPRAPGGVDRRDHAAGAARPRRASKASTPPRPTSTTRPRVRERQRRARSPSTPPLRPRHARRAGRLQGRQLRLRRDGAHGKFLVAATPGRTRRTAGTELLRAPCWAATPRSPRCSWLPRVPSPSLGGLVTLSMLGQDLPGDRVGARGVGHGRLRTALRLRHRGHGPANGAQPRRARVRRRPARRGLRVAGRRRRRRRHPVVGVADGLGPSRPTVRGRALVDAAVAGRGGNRLRGGGRCRPAGPDATWEAGWSAPPRTRPVASAALAGSRLRRCPSGSSAPAWRRGRVGLASRCVVRLGRPGRPRPDRQQQRVRGHHRPRRRQPDRLVSPHRCWCCR